MFAEANRKIDCVYVAASSQDARYTRICIASVRYFYPEIPIRVLPGGRLQRRLVDELKHYWSVEIADLPLGNYGWGFVKLEALFGRTGEKFLVLDSDTVLVGPVLGEWRGGMAHFVVDDEKQSDSDAAAIYYDWEKVRQFDPNARKPLFLFNTGQWFGTAGVLTRDDFHPWINWDMPRTTQPTGCFKNGEQGVLNYVMNQNATLGKVLIERRKILRYPAFGMEGIGADTVCRCTAPALVVHWAGLKRARQRDMLAADLLAFFESKYYERFQAGQVRKLLAAIGHFSAHWKQSGSARVAQRLFQRP